MFLRDLLAVVIIAGVYSLLMAAIFTQLDAVDVAFTEASVGAGISTVLLLATLALIKNQKADKYEWRIPAIILALLTGALLLYSVPALPLFGNPQTPIHHHVAPQ